MSPPAQNLIINKISAHHPFAVETFFIFILNTDEFNCYRYFHVHFTLHWNDVLDRKSLLLLIKKIFLHRTVCNEYKRLYYRFNCLKCFNSKFTIYIVEAIIITDKSSRKNKVCGEGKVRNQLKLPVPRSIQVTV